MSYASHQQPELFDSLDPNADPVSIRWNADRDEEANTSLDNEWRWNDTPTDAKTAYLREWFHSEVL